MKNILASFFLFLAFSTQLISSNSIVAGHIEWTYIGQDSFLVKLFLVRDCNGSELNDAKILVYNDKTNDLLQTLNLKTSYPMDITPSCRKFNPAGCTRCSDPQCEFPYGFEQYTIYSLLVLDSTLTDCKIKLVYSSCCRSSQLENIKQGQGFHIYSILNRCIKPGDNSPISTYYQLLYTYNNIFRKVNMGFYDQDVTPFGNLFDSLIFKIAVPKSEIGDVEFEAPYSFEKPLPFLGFPDHLLASPQGFKITNEFAEVHFTPIKTGLYSFTIKVEEYRDQVIIGEMLVDNAILVITDTFIHAPQIRTETYYKEVYPDSTVTFIVNCWHPDPKDTLRFIYNCDIEGATWTDNYRQTNHPTGIFTWTPDQSKVNDIPYNFVVSLRTPCGLQGSADRAFQIKVVNPGSNVEEKSVQKIVQVINSQNSLLQVNCLKKPSLLIIYAMDGKVVFQRNNKELPMNSIQISTDSFPSGYYTILVQIDGEFYPEKVLIK